MNFRPLITIKFLLFVGLSPLFSDQNSHSNQINSRHDSGSCCDPCCTICSPPKDPCGKCAQLWTTRGPDRIVTPGAGPCVSSNIDLFLTADFIYWAVRQDKMGFAQVSNPATNVSSPESKKGSIFHPDWKMEPGFKVGLGWLTCIDGWDLSFRYTWLRPNHTKESVKPSDAPTTDFILSPIANWVVDVNGLTAKITSNWKMNINIFDFELGRNFYISKCLYLRPHFGLKGAWFDQKNDVIAFADPEDANITNSSSYKIDWAAIGIRSGLDTSWNFSKCFSLYGNVAGSILWGTFDSTKKDLLRSPSTVPSYYVENDIKTNKPVFEAALGIRFEDWYCCDNYYLSLELGWEMQWWRGQNQYFAPRTETRLGDLGMQGLTIQARFQF